MDVKNVGEDTKNLLTAATGYAIIKIIQTGGAIMVKHWVYYPRNFGNEYDVIRTENAGEEKELFEWTMQNDILWAKVNGGYIMGKYLELPIDSEEQE